ncbi:MAG: RNA 2',3'-cyclic phosphodiesterase [Rhodospirillaceae bacterium]|jgi:RNA 2',3'-cyclic 3'-phosphodiesterase|nr:RNA 2',3'-cyclic phosphodiesterase [Rhodospirillaceae bacterium]MBT6117420.1 RNA 2',3'-cyclic phosphodiesterase [Rhodospirillaceae bacterium]
MIRLFVGLELPPALRERLAGLGAGIEGVRWVDEENLHLTLRFIGEVDGGQAEDIAEALDRVRAAPFKITLDGLGTFGSGARLRAVWVGVMPSPPLRALQGKVERAVQRAGLAGEGRRFIPHVTLARLGSGAAKDRLGPFIEYNAAFRSKPVPVTGFTLFESFLSSGGADYQAVERFPLAGRET